jgi:hypothetical protein
MKNIIFSAALIITAASLGHAMEANNNMPQGEALKETEGNPSITRFDHFAGETPVECRFLPERKLFDYFAHETPVECRFVSEDEGK